MKINVKRVITTITTANLETKTVDEKTVQQFGISVKEAERICFNSIPRGEIFISCVSNADKVSVDIPVNLIPAILKMVAEENENA